MPDALPTFIAELAARTVQGAAPKLQLAHRWLDNWRGVGQIADEIHRAGWDLQLTDYGDGHWRATFYVTGQAHSIVGGTGWESTPWRAVQRASLSALDNSVTRGD